MILNTGCVDHGALKRCGILLQLLALILLLFFHGVIDKVLVHNSLSTLDVLVIVLLILGVFKLVTKGLREYRFISPPNYIDICLGLNLFKHRFSLPLSYFKSQQVGAIVSRISELNSIRHLLTSELNHRLYRHLLNPSDAIFIPIAWWYRVEFLDVSISTTFIDFNTQNQFYRTFSERCKT